MQAEGVKFIGDNGSIFGPDGSVQRALSHSVKAEISADIGRDNQKGAVAGAIAAELAGVNMGNSFEGDQHWNEKKQH